MYSVTSKKLLPFLVILSLFFICGFYTIQNYVALNRKPYYFINWTFSESISCHYVKDGDALPAIEDLTPPPANSIFFHETSCRGGLNSRQACAVESVSRIHPERPVYVFFNSPVSELVLTRSSLAKLTQFKNVKLARLHTAEYAKGTPVQEMFASNEIERSDFRIEHTADILRDVTLYKYGGMYLDTDSLVVKPMNDLGANWIGREDDSIMSIGAISIDRDGPGHELFSNILNDIKSSYQPTEWSYNGNGAVTRALLNFCNASSLLELNADKCHGFNIYGPSTLYPVHWTDMTVYFKPGNLSEEAEAAYMHHLWNKLSYDQPVRVDSPYDKLSKKYCPTIREMYGERFGS